MKRWFAILVSAVLTAGIFSSTAWAELGGEAAPTVTEAATTEEVVAETAAPEVVNGIAEAEAVMETSSSEDGSLTPDGNLTLVDDIGSTTDEGLQFITLVTKSGNTFYLIIDRNTDGTENVHFLNLVDEADLLALMDEDEAAQYQAETEAAATPEPVESITPTEIFTAETAEKEQKSSSPLPLVMLLMFVVGAAGVGGYLYLKMKGGLPHKQAETPDPDADYLEEYEDEIQLPTEMEEDEDDYEEEDFSDDEPV